MNFLLSFSGISLVPLRFTKNEKRDHVAVSLF